MRVCSDKNRIRRYWVETEDQPSKLLFESNSAYEAIQWAIDHCSDIAIEGEFELESDGILQGHDAKYYEEKEVKR